jgi:hypothetical protein
MNQDRKEKKIFFEWKQKMQEGKKMDKVSGKKWSCFEINPLKG